jgi:hypothetical protein
MTEPAHGPVAGEAAGPGPGEVAGPGPGEVAGDPARLGALRDTLAIVTSVATGATRAAERARGLADRLGDDRDRMLLELGGGPPPELREAAARNRDAVTALDEAATALREAAAALRAFARRSG